MSTSTAIAISTAQSSAVMAMAAEAERKACEVMISTFDPKGASVKALQMYSECIERIYPNDMSPESIAQMKVFILICFAGAVFGAVKGYQEDGVVMSIVSFIVAFLVTGVVAFIIGLALYAVGVIH